MRPMSNMASFVSALCYILFTMKKGTVLDQQQAEVFVLGLGSPCSSAIALSIHSKSDSFNGSSFSGHSRITATSGKPALVPVS